MQIKLIVITIFCALIWSSYQYLQFQLVRIPHRSKVYNYGIVQCMSDLPKKKQKQQNVQGEERRMLTSKHKSQQEEKNKQQNESEEDQDQNENQKQIEEQIQDIEKKEITDSDNFKQICYEKDISYAIQLFNSNRQLLYLSMDMTVPISWVKSQKCFIAETHRKCNRIQVNFNDEMKKLQKKFKSLLKNPFRKKTKKTKKQMNNQFALIQGSSQIVKGPLEKSQNLQFSTNDSGRLTRLLDVILLGIGIKQFKSNLKFTNTTFISASQISPALNYLCDGAISLRFDENSQSSFLKQMSNLAQTTQSYVTIFIGKNNQSITIGDLSVKNSAQGLSSVNWISVQQDQNHGKLPICHGIQLTQSLSQSHKQISVKIPLVLTLSASFISIPQDTLMKFMQKFFRKSTCSLQKQTRYVVCQKMTMKDIQTKQLNFQVNQTSIMIPFKNLVMQSKSHKIKFNLKSSLDERYIILGEPVFQKYFVALDYQNNRIGLSLQRQKFVTPLINVVTLIRFVVWAFILGCCCICLALPIQRCYAIVSSKMATQIHKYSKTKKVRDPNDQNKKMNVYQSVNQQNPYQDIRGKIQQIITEQAQGI